MNPPDSYGRTRAQVVGFAGLSVRRIAFYPKSLHVDLLPTDT
jgi:hypothetical protein